MQLWLVRHHTELTVHTDRAVKLQAQTLDIIPSFLEFQQWNCSGNLADSFFRDGEDLETRCLCMFGQGLVKLGLIAEAQVEIMS